MSEASAHKLSYTPETTRGTLPANARFKALPDTRTTLNLTRESLTSERITGTRFPQEPRSGVNGVSGDIPADLSSRAYDDFIASALQGSWVEAGVGQDSITLVQDSVPIPDTVVGAEISTDNGLVKVEFIDAKAQHVILAYYDGAGPVVTETHEIFADASVTIDGDVFNVTLYTDVEEDATVKAGDTRLSFSILREFSDFEAGEKPFLLYSGCEVASWNIQATANAVAKSTFTLFGRDMSGPSTDAPVGSSVSPAFDTEVFDTFSGAMEIDGVETCIVTDYNVTINNGHAPRYGLGCPSSQDPTVLMSVIDGSITAYFENADLYEKFVDEGSLALRLTLSDSDNNQMVIYLPNCKVGPGTQPDVTADGPINITVNFTAHYDAALGSHISVRRLYPVAA